MAKESILTEMRILPRDAIDSFLFAGLLPNLIFATLIFLNSPWQQQQT
jgi:hypothetical protein